MKTANFYSITDPYPKQGFNGGGPESEQNLIDNLKECGYEVKLCRPITEWLNPDNADLNIYSNIFNDPEGSKWFTTDQYFSLLKTKSPYIFSENAYTACSTKPYCIDEQGNMLKGDPLTEFTRPFFQHAAITLSTSPLHLHTMEDCLGLELPNGYCYFQEVNTKKFFNTNEPRKDIEYLYVGACNFAKGFDIVAQKYGDKGLVVFGPPYKCLHHSKMPEIYSRTKKVVHLPRWKEPFHRGAAEAALCGCELITNKNVGALSFNLQLDRPENYIESKEKIKQLIKDKFK